MNNSWEIAEVKVDEASEEISVELKYCQPYIEVGKQRYGIYDHHPMRCWRHLDLWQYKTLY
ncbi:MAG: hypothetical protein LBL90_01065 [Prevotellaceae bacterium]|nr:hypothetical protein [Prevotellaceae bacterium]